MRTHKHFCLTLLCMLTVYGSVFAQGDCFFNRSYTLQKDVSFSVSSDIQERDIGNYDLLKARAYSNTIHVESCIQPNGEFETIKTYNRPAMNPDKWGPKIFKSIVRPSYTEYFSEEGELLYATPENQRANRQTAISEMNEIDWDLYGYSETVAHLDQELLSVLAADFESIIEFVNGSYIARNADLTIEFDPNENAITYNHYQEGVLLHSRKEVGRIAANGKRIPFYTIINSYEHLSVGGFLCRKETLVYSDYSINNTRVEMSGGVSELQSTDSKKGDILDVFPVDVMTLDDEIRVIPNPVQNSFELQTVLKINSVNIYSSEGVLVSKYEENKRYDVQGLNSGMYFIEICTKDHRIMKPLIIVQ